MPVESNQPAWDTRGIPASAPTTLAAHGTGVGCKVLCSARPVYGAMRLHLVHEPEAERDLDDEEDQDREEDERAGEEPEQDEPAEPKQDGQRHTHNEDGHVAVVNEDRLERADDLTQRTKGVRRLGSRRSDGERSDGGRPEGTGVTAVQQDLSRRRTIWTYDANSRV